jgi:four helix bundle protein
MGVQHFSELVVWQVAELLREHVAALIKNERASRDFEFCDQIRRASSSLSDTIAEGFGRYSHGDLGRFFTIALASRNEVENQLRRGLRLGYFSKDEWTVGTRLIKRHTRAMSRFMRHLRTNDAPPPFQGREP